MSNPAPGFTRYPNHRVVATQSPRHVRVLVGEEVIADSRTVFQVEESQHDPVWYFPPQDVNQNLLRPTDTTTYCPFKGNASYYTIEVGNQSLEDAVWSYREPFDECRALAGCYAFYPDRVRVEVDGEPQRPT
jgi:uncharacterized protein (DUF427 family)